MPTFTPDLKREYEDLFASAVIRPEHLAEVDRTVDRIFAQTAIQRYREVERATGVPAHVVGIIHVREASQNFNTHLHNGDPLSARTWHVPAGRPPHGNPPFTWTDSAADALTMPGQALDRWHDWTAGGLAYVLERFNGFGYRNRGIHSPYLWGYTTAYDRGLYVADGQFDPDAVNRNPGGMALLKRMLERGLISGAAVPAKPVKAPLRTEQAIAAFRKATLRLQTRLKDAGFDPGKLDGLYGDRTDKALQGYLRRFHP